MQLFDSFRPSFSKNRGWVAVSMALFALWVWNSGDPAMTCRWLTGGVNAGQQRISGWSRLQETVELGMAVPRLVELSIKVKASRKVNKSLFLNARNHPICAQQTFWPQTGTFNFHFSGWLEGYANNLLLCSWIFLEGAPNSWTKSCFDFIRFGHRHWLIPSRCCCCRRHMFICCYFCCRFITFRCRRSVSFMSFPIVFLVVVVHGVVVSCYLRVCCFCCCNVCFVAVMCVCVVLFVGTVLIVASYVIFFMFVWEFSQLVNEMVYGRTMWWQFPIVLVIFPWFCWFLGMLQIVICCCVMPSWMLAAHYGTYILSCRWSLNMFVGCELPILRVHRCNCAHQRYLWFSHLCSYVSIKHNVFGLLYHLFY